MNRERQGFLLLAERFVASQDLLFAVEYVAEIKFRDCSRSEIQGTHSNYFIQHTGFWVSRVKTELLLGCVDTLELILLARHKP
jgi:hypothetical protein